MGVTTLYALNRLPGGGVSLPDSPGCTAGSAGTSASFCHEPACIVSENSTV